MKSSSTAVLPHGFTVAAVGAIGGILYRQLADHAVLALKLRHAHWNVGGPQFSELHALFAGQFTTLDAQIDQLAERMRMFGVPVDASFQAFLHDMRMSEFAAPQTDASALLTNLSIDYEQISRRLREDALMLQNEFDDLVSADLLIGLAAAHDKAAWFLRAHLNGR